MNRSSDKVENPKGIFCNLMPSSAQFAILLNDFFGNNSKLANKECSPNGIP